ncbi:FAD-binding oxidoreductase [Xinfangfangia sp. D13-10-4-6]|uniref:NAD(P)/FAD-dependent oxidoreductase n=1 Tax=Pseudogemmobacter hezensis TaxID=2737662 RepID=UPI0015538660|nr:FAD-binding oxidoreductase [Pseudogemmobacter hezensis]NPD15173.1 FAD-binding oxidoreductase [Pseudogemmobacter hezensis]
MAYDFIIIGGGIAGISLAARLAEKAAGRVLVLEQEESLAHHASGRSAALYEPNYGHPAVVGLSKASEAWFRGQPGILSPRGLLMVAGEAEAQAFHHDRETMEMQQIPPDEARQMVPILRGERVTLAALSTAAEDIDTDLLLQNFAREARAAGTEIRVKTRVSQINRVPEGWHVSWPGGEAEGRILINAAGAWVDQVAALAGVSSPGFAPLRRSMARIPAPEGLDVSKWPMVFGPAESWYMKPDAGALIVSPAEEDAVDAPHDAWADDMVLAEGLARYEEFVTEPVTRLLANWAGLRTFAPDRVPVIGFAPGDAGFFWLAGQGGYGFQTAPAASRLAADLLLGQTPDLAQPLVAALSPDRFL